MVMHNNCENQTFHYTSHCHNIKKTICGLKAHSEISLFRWKFSFFDGHFALNGGINWDTNRTWGHPFTLSFISSFGIKSFSPPLLHYIDITFLFRGTRGKLRGNNIFKKTLILFLSTYSMHKTQGQTDWDNFRIFKYKMCFDRDVLCFLNAYLLTTEWLGF